MVNKLLATVVIDNRLNKNGTQNTLERCSDKCSSIRLAATKLVQNLFFREEEGNIVADVEDRRR